MSDPIDPPRPSLTTGTRNTLAGCTWNATKGAVVDASGDQVYAWLTQTNTPTTTVTVQWEVGTATTAGSVLVLAVITQTTHDIVKNGSHNANTGIVTYGGTGYRFRFERNGSGVPTMAPSAV